MIQHIPRELIVVLERHALGEEEGRDICEDMSENAKPRPSMRHQPQRWRCSNIVRYLPAAKARLELPRSV